MARTYYIAGQEVYVNSGWSISDKINTRSTLSITVIDPLSATIDEGETFQIYSDATKIFEGIILRVRRTEIFKNELSYGLDIVDNSAIADKRLIAKVYENTLAGDIVRDIITLVLGLEGVTVGSVIDGPVIKKAVFNYIKCSEALEYLKKVTGLNWNIDIDKKLYFFDRATNVSPYILSDSIQHSNFTHETNMDSYRNTQYVRGGRGKTATQTAEIPTPKPDGKSKNFVLRFPIAEKPSIEINLNGAGWVAVSSSDIGINGLDTSKKWYYSYDSPIITQDSTQTVIEDVDQIRVTYIGLKNLFTKAESVGEITNRATKEGNSGIYENMAVETSISTSEQAIEFGQGLLQTYGEVKDSISFKTETSGLLAGQLLTVNKPLYGINGSFLIESVNIVPLGIGTIEYSVKALDGAIIGGWEEFFKELLKGNRDYAIQENEVIILLQTQSEIEGYQGATNIYTFNALYPSNVLYPSDVLCPNNTIASQEVLSD